MLAYRNPPTVEISTPQTKDAGVRLLVRREDLNHPFVAGNKWWKLKHNLAEARRQGDQTLLTFGGVFSNHLYATAAAARELGFDSIGIVRGERMEPLNPTLQFAEDQGMVLHFVSREQYRRKTETEFIDHLRELFGAFYLLPEGGTNVHAVRGCAEWASEIGNDFDVLALPVGTGGSMAGLICGFDGKKHIVGITVLKNGDFLHNDIHTLVHRFAKKRILNWSLLTQYHHGGYAKVSNELTDFIRAMKRQHDLPLDQVYTGKLIWGLLREIDARAFPRGTTVVALHTGGLQGLDKNIFTGA